MTSPRPGGLNGKLFDMTVKKDATKGGAHTPITMRSPAAGLDGGFVLAEAVDDGEPGGDDDGVPGAAVPALVGTTDGETIGAAQPARTVARTSSASATEGRRRDDCPTPRILQTVAVNRLSLSTQLVASGPYAGGCFLACILGGSRSGSGSTPTISRNPSRQLG